MALYSVIEQAYGIGRIRSVVKQDSGDLRFSCTDGEEYILKEKEDTAGLMDEYLLQAKARQAGLSVETLVKTTDDRFYVEHNNACFALYAALDGLSPDVVQGEDNSSCLVACGNAVGRLHRSLAEESFTGIREMNVSEDLAGPGRKELKKVFADRKLLELVDVVTGYFSSADAGLPRQPVIGGPRFERILMDGDGAAGFTGLERVMNGYRLWDVCFLAGEVLYDLADKNMDLEIWPSRVRGLCTGYLREVSLTPTEQKSLPFMLYLVQLSEAVRCLREQRRKYAIRHIDLLKFSVTVSALLDLPGRTGES